jgi:GPH family glycoside/pentoside/hexuronide:cation symporter
MSEPDTSAAPRGLWQKSKGWLFDRPPGPVYTASNWIIHTWGIGGMAEQWIYSCFAWIAVVFTTGYGVDTRLMGWALLAPRILDGLLDPIIGHLSDITRTRWGRRRPFILGSAIFAGIVVIAMWWMSPDWPVWAQFGWIVAFATLTFFAYGTYSMSHAALGYELSDDYNLRSKVMAVKGLYTSIMAIFSALLYPFVMALVNGVFDPPIFGYKLFAINVPKVGSEPDAWRWVSPVLALLIIGSAIFPFIFCKERFQDAAKRPHVNVWQALRATMHNRPFVALLLVRFAKTFGTTLYLAMAFYVNLYCVGGGDKAQTTFIIGFLGSISGLAVSFLLVPLAAPLTRKLNKRRGLILGFGFAFLASVALPFFCQPGHLEWVFIHGLIFMVPGAILGLFLSAVIPDICDIDELANGERREGLFSAVMAFVDKLENSVCFLLAGYMLAWAGISMKAPAQTPEAINNLRWFAFTPYIVFSGLAFGLSFMIPLTQKLMDDVRLRLNERRAAIAAAEALEKRD